MKNKTKEYTIHFLVGDVSSPAATPSQEGRQAVAKILADIESGNLNLSSPYHPDEYYYHVDGVEKQGNLLQGVFKKFRQDELPKKGKIGTSDEQHLGLKNDEALLEKNHFLFDSKRNVLLYQSYQPGSAYPKFGGYLGHISGTVVKFAPIPKVDRLADFLSAPATGTKSFDIAIARPANAEGFKPLSGDFSDQILSLISASGADFIKLKLGVRTLKLGDGKPSFRDIGKDIIASLRRHESIDLKGKVRFVDEDGNPSLIDLVMNRIIVRIKVSMEGKYPLSHDLFDKMKQAMVDEKTALDEYLGKND